MIHHPDKGGKKEKFQKIHTAYEILTGKREESEDNNDRSNYDFEAYPDQEFLSFIYHRIDETLTNAKITWDEIKETAENLSIKGNKEWIGYWNEYKDYKSLMGSSFYNTKNKVIRFSSEIITFIKSIANIFHTQKRTKSKTQPPKEAPKQTTSNSSSTYGVRQENLTCGYCQKNKTIDYFEVFNYGGEKFCSSDCYFKYSNEKYQKQFEEIKSSWNQETQKEQNELKEELKNEPNQPSFTQTNNNNQNSHYPSWNDLKTKWKNEEVSIDNEEEEDTSNQREENNSENSLSKLEKKKRKAIKKIRDELTNNNISNDELNSWKGVDGWDNLINNLDDEIEIEAIEEQLKWAIQEMVNERQNNNYQRGRDFNSGESPLTYLLLGLCLLAIILPSTIVIRKKISKKRK